jgi:hypothetical protein
MSAIFPERGFVFWPVGTGDSTTIVLDKDTVAQVDINHLEKGDDADDPCLPIVDELERLLPDRDGSPYLALFVLTHPDTDHCRGFSELLRRVTIGELWFSPRIFNEYTEELGEDAKAFKAEAMRRVKATISASKKGEIAGAGDRVRIVGYEEVLEKDDYEGFPKDRLSIPGTSVTHVDGDDVSRIFRAFVHAPFKDDIAADRNDSSVGLQVTLTDGNATGQALLLGDLCYPTVSRIFDMSDASNLEWNVFLAPHHCSKSVMFWKTDGEEAKLQEDLLKKIENTAGTSGYVVVSSNPIPATNKDGDNPPHAIAKREYEQIAPNGVLCTMEYPDGDTPKMMVFSLTTDGLSLVDAPETSRADAAARLHADIEMARGAPAPVAERVGFGSIQ